MEMEKTYTINVTESELAKFLNLEAKSVLAREQRKIEIKEAVKKEQNRLEIDANKRAAINVKKVNVNAKKAKREASQKEYHDTIKPRTPYIVTAIRYELARLKASGISCNDIAKMTGVSLSQVWRILNGKQGHNLQAVELFEKAGLIDLARHINVDNQSNIVDSCPYCGATEMLCGHNGIGCSRLH